MHVVILKSVHLELHLYTPHHYFMLIALYPLHYHIHHRKLFVNTHHWISDKTFADLFALGNALPGPGSTQLAFSIALVRNGTTAGFLAFFVWS